MVEWHENTDLITIMVLVQIYIYLAVLMVVMIMESDKKLNYPWIYFLLNSSFYKEVLLFFKYAQCNRMARRYTTHSQRTSIP